MKDIVEEAKLEKAARYLADQNGYEITSRVPSMVDDREFPRVAEFVGQARGILQIFKETDG